MFVESFVTIRKKKITDLHFSSSRAHVLERCCFPTCPLDHLEAYLFPPFVVIRGVVNKVMTSEDMTVVLVAPLWLQND